MYRPQFWVAIHVSRPLKSRYWYPRRYLRENPLGVCAESEDVNNHKMHEYLVAVNEILNDEAVIGFFTSLARLGLTSTPNV